MARIVLMALALVALPALAAEPEGRTVYFDVAKGGALGGLITAATAYLYSLRKQRTQISPDPLNVRGIPASVKSPTCDAIHKGIDKQLEDNDNDHASIFPRLTNLENRISLLEGVMTEIRNTNKSVDETLKIILRKLK